tara:strand:- start:7026 stop:8165 length:1140 start_codon:yes stop_codon:yes gene_type:complete
MGDLIKYKFTGKVVDANTLLPLIGVEVTFNNNTTTTRKSGKFLLKGEVDSDTLPPIGLSLKGYSSKSKLPYTSKNKLKSDLGILKLQTNNVDVELEKLTATQLPNEFVETSAKSTLVSGAATQKLLTKSLSNIQNILLPVVLSLLAAFGISQALKYLKDQEVNLNPQCPTDEDLIILIKKRNALVKQLNNLYKTVDTALIALGVLEGIVLTFKTLFTLLKVTPVPTPPPGVPSLVPPIQDLKPIIEKNISKFGSITTGTILILTSLRSFIQITLNLLSLLDQQIQNCSSDAILEEVNSELRELNNKQEQQGNTPPNSINGFTFDVETETTTNSLKRSRAIAKNSQGVILLRGEYSYSATNPILIDELVFYIQTNNLKAN